MDRAMQSISYRSYYLLVGKSSDFCLLVKILVENKAFELEAGRKIKEIKFIDLFIYGSRIIAARNLIEKY